MTRWHTLEPADEAFFKTAPHLYRFVVDLSVPPERVWESLQSDESVTAWGLGVQSLRWQNPRPFGVGTTREVVLPLHAMTLREKFFIWDEGNRYSFYVAEANRPLIRRFAEDYVVEARAGGTRFTWTIALEPQPRYKRIVDLGRPVNKLAFGQLARGAKAYFAKNP
jgi:Polyketide cyclase / dehydrase and lipid transport